MDRDVFKEQFVCRRWAFMAEETCLIRTSLDRNVRKIEECAKSERYFNIVGEEEYHFVRRLPGFALSSF
jgi:hypothetical protein